MSPTDPAFPVPNQCYGLTRRELFAAMAMQGLLVADTDMVIPADTTARMSVEHTDALIAELNKRPGETNVISDA